MTLIEAINGASAKLAAAGIDNTRLDAELLLRHILGKDRAWVLMHERDALREQDRTAYARLIDRRCAREPLQQIIGRQEFWGLDFIVSPHVLIPRPETELVVETALGLVKDTNRQLAIVDLCTGSGCIAVSLARALASARVFATDSSAQALEVARSNARNHGVSDRIRFMEGDLFAPLNETDLEGQIDILTSNPPYVPSGDLPGLQPEVKDHEPHAALIAGPEGTEFHGRIIALAPQYLKTGGALIMEMGIGQAQALKKMIRDAEAYGDPEILKDLAGIERVIMARKK